LSWCELAARYNLCPKIRDQRCQNQYRKIEGRCTGPIKCDAKEHNSNGHCCPEGENWSQRNKKCQKLECKDGEELKDGKCIQSKCPRFQVRVGGKCQLRCTKDQELYPSKDSVGCAPVCKKGEHVHNGKCTPNWSGCRTKEECQNYYMARIQAAKIKKQSAQEALRQNTTSKHRRMQSMVPKKSQEALEDDYATAWKE
jgi:hypothetical protein